MLRATIIAAFLASLVVASPTKTPLPARYNNSLAGATFLYSAEDGGIQTPPSQYEDVYIQAVDGRLVFQQGPPTRVCPCSSSFGAQNFTGYYVGGTNDAPTLQLFTSSPGAQYVYVAKDLSIRYTLPGEPVPVGANGTSIFIYDPEPLGDGLPSTGIASVEGHVTHLNGTKTYYNGLQFCALKYSPPRTENGVGPLMISATKTQGNVPGGKAVIGDRCIEGFFENSIDDPKVGPYYIAFMTPSEPLAFAYEGGY